MARKPFIPLVERRDVDRPELPSDLAEFYASAAEVSRLVARA